MDQVQGWLSSGSNGKEKTEEEQGHKEDEIVEGLVKKLKQKDGQEKVNQGEVVIGLLRPMTVRIHTITENGKCAVRNGFCFPS